MQSSTVLSKIPPSQNLVNQLFQTTKYDRGLADSSQNAEFWSVVQNRRSKTIKLVAMIECHVSPFPRRNLFTVKAGRMGVMTGLTTSGNFVIFAHPEDSKGIKFDDQNTFVLPRVTTMLWLGIFVQFVRAAAEMGRRYLSKRP